mmetsp:Transcript_36325/g.71475  ORF Transcript_36325/g.71475 Transcript_36325/m.71475 type:complete len:200 (-) Transcript_36325:46-645(-)
MDRCDVSVHKEVCGKLLRCSSVLLERSVKLFLLIKGVPLLPQCFGFSLLRGLRGLSGICSGLCLCLPSCLLCLLSSVLCFLPLDGLLLKLRVVSHDAGGCCEAELIHPGVRVIWVQASVLQQILHGLLEVHISHIPLKFGFLQHFDDLLGLQAALLVGSAVAVHSLSPVSHLRTSIKGLSTRSSRKPPTNKVVSRNKEK